MKRTGLNTNPETTRAFVQRSRQRARERARAQHELRGTPEPPAGTAEHRLWLEANPAPRWTPDDQARLRAQGREGMLSMLQRAATPPSDFRDDHGHPIAGEVRDAPRGLTPGQRRRGVKIPARARRHALARSHDACVMCLHRNGIDANAVSNATVRQLMRVDLVAKATQLHHVFPRQRWPQLIKVAANLIGVCPGCHDEHERAHRRIPLAALPACVFDLVDADPEADRLLLYLDATYPA